MTDSAISSNWQVHCRMCGQTHSCPKSVYTVRTDHAECCAGVGKKQRSGAVDGGDASEPGASANNLKLKFIVLSARQTGRSHYDSAKPRMIAFLPLWVPLLEVSYHLRIKRGVSLRVGLSAKRKPRRVFPLTGVHP